MSDKSELYANYGEAFHANDVRGVTIRFDPVTNDPIDRVQVGQGAERGNRRTR